MKYLLVLLLLVGCADSDGVYIERHHVSREQMKTLCVGNDTCDANAKWRQESDGSKSCDIYLLYQEEYSSEHEYFYKVGHETQHCFDGHHHN